MGTALMPKLASLLLIYGMVLLTDSVMQRGLVKCHMAARRLHREATVTAPYFSLAPDLLLGTDVIITTSRHFA